MITRYTKEKMGQIWTEENEFRRMLDVEIYACEAQAELGVIPADAVKVIREKADFDVDRIHEIEKETNHDIISFVSSIAEFVGEEAKYVHMGLTSTDVKDTALCAMLVEATDLLLDDLEAFAEVLRRRALEFKHTPMIGRTHGIHAEPTTFGLKLLLWYDETQRNLRRLRAAREEVRVGKISGAVGTYANVDPFVEQYVCDKMGLVPAKISTQVLQRDRHAAYITTLAVIGSSIDKFATEIRNLQRTDIREAEEYFSPKQKGSSAMPHKRNPITCERMSGMARLLRGYTIPALEDVALWHERDISHSSVERVILGDATITLDYMLQTFTRVMDRLLVYPDTMLANMNKTGGLIYSQRILLALVDHGVMRDTAYRWVQRNAMKRWLEGEDFFENLVRDEDIRQYLSEDDIRACFNPHAMLKHVDTIFARFDLSESKGE